MTVSVEQLAGPIRDILNTPGIDLATISAKRVRLQLLQRDPNLSEDWVRANKADIDGLIAKVYQSTATNRMDAASMAENQKATTAPAKRKREVADDEGLEPPSSQPIATSSKSSSSKAHVTNGAPRAGVSTSSSKNDKSSGTKVLNDEEYARKLNEELNGRTELRRAAAKPKASSGSRQNKKPKKSAARVGSDEDEVNEQPKPRKGGFHKELQLSEPLAILLGQPRASRPQVVKKLWEYIKENGLQNPANKREILCDSQLRQVFNSDRVGMMDMNKRLGDCLYPIEE